MRKKIYEKYDKVKREQKTFIGYAYSILINRRTGLYGQF